MGTASRLNMVDGASAKTKPAKRVPGGLKVGAEHEKGREMGGLLKDETARLAKAIRAVAYTAYSNTLRGSALPMDQQTYERMTNPQVGDLVCEISTVWFDDRAADAVGFLDSITWEPVEFGDPDFVWDEKAEGRPHPTEKVFNLTTLDGRPYRWINANFIAAPDKPMR